MMLNKKTLVVGVFVVLLPTFLLAQKSTQNTESVQNKWTKTFAVDKRQFVSTGDNSYFILKPGYYLILEGKENKKNGKLVVTVLNETKVVDGVETRIVEEREFINGELVEISKNYFVIDKMTNSVFYFGEDVDIYENERIISHEGAWHSGEKGAKFGLMMPGMVLLGARYYQEIAKEIAMDRAEIISVTETIETPAGTFTECLKTEETNPLEPGEKEYKIYAPGIGLVKDGNFKLVEFGYK